MFVVETVNFEFYILDFELGNLDLGFWNSDVDGWILNLGCLDVGVCILAF